MLDVIVYFHVSEIAMSVDSIISVASNFLLLM